MKGLIIKGLPQGEELTYIIGHSTGGQNFRVRDDHRAKKSGDKSHKEGGGEGGNSHHNVLTTSCNSNEEA